MPKRPATPPPADDSLFFTVINPYPVQPQLATEDSKSFVRWIACIIGQDNLLCFYYKPKSPSVVVIEVSKDGVSDFRRLLGEHRWCEILRASNEDNAHEASNIFPCTLTTQWALEKIRWLRLDVASSWFKKWSPEKDSDIVHPYPMPHFCKPPQEDVLRTPLCRPIPEELFHDAPHSATKPILAPVPRLTTSLAYRGPAILSGSDFDDDTEDDEIPLTPPGLAPVPPTHTFVPAIHGADIPKNNGVSVPPPPSSDSSEAESDDAEEVEKMLWPGYGEKDAPPRADLCKVHGVMCTSGICRQCGQLKRDAKWAERKRKREEEREASNRERERRDGRGFGRGFGRRRWRGRDEDERGSARSSSNASSRASKRSSSAGSESAKKKSDSTTPREDIPATTTKAKVIRGAGGSAKAAGAKPIRELPPHLRKGAAKGANPAPASSPVGSLSSASAVPSCVPSVASSDSSSSSIDDRDARSVRSASKSNTSGLKPAPFTKAINWQAYAKVPAGNDGDDGASESTAVTGLTADPFKNPWKHVQSAQTQRAPTRWADMVDEDEDDEDDLYAEDAGGLPRGVTVIPSAMEREEVDSECESVFSMWDQEPF